MHGARIDLDGYDTVRAEITPDGMLAITWIDGGDDTGIDQELVLVFDAPAVAIEHLMDALAALVAKLADQ